MLASSSVKLDHVSTFLPKSSKPSSQPAPHACRVKAAIKQLEIQSDVSKLSQFSVSASSRPLQTLDLNSSHPGRQEASASTATSSSPPPKPASAKKVRSPSSKQTTTTSRAVKKAFKSGALLTHAVIDPAKGERVSVKVPQKLPAPRLKPLSSPYEDLVGHFARHHLFTESESVAQNAITPDFFLTKYLDMAHLGKCSLYHQTSNFLDANRDIISAHVRPGEALPPTVPIDVTELMTTLQVPPTHLLAVHSDTQGATLYAAHAVVLALQCVSIPFLPASRDRQEGGHFIRDMPTLALRVPSAQHFNTILRWLYSQSSTSLLQELLPLKHIVSYLAQRRLAQRNSSLPSDSDETSKVDVSNLSGMDLVEAMSTMSTRSFLELLQTIQAVWKNGVALGIVSWGFWTQLDNAWNLVISAMVASKRRSRGKVTAAANELSAQLQSTRIE